MDSQLIDKLDLSNKWPDAKPIKEGNALEGFAVDLHGETLITYAVSKTRTLDMCRQFAKAVKQQCPGSKIRPFAYTDHQLHTENSKNRDNNRWDAGYGGYATPPIGKVGKADGPMVKHIRRKCKVYTCEGGNIAKESFAATLEGIRHANKNVSTR